MPRVELRCQAILFDLDGVLVDSRAVVERTWRRWAERHRIRPNDLVAKAHGRRSVETVRAVAPHLDVMSEVRWLEAAELSDVDGLLPVPGAAALLDSVPDSRRAVVTSGGRALARLRLAAVGFALPSVIVAAEDVAHGKPAPDGYVRAASLLGVDPSHCVVLEDAPPGIVAGTAAGATVIAVATTFPRSQLSRARLTVDTLAVLRVSVHADRLDVAVDQ